MNLNTIIKYIHNNHIKMSSLKISQKNSYFILYSLKQ